MFENFHNKMLRYDLVKINMAKVHVLCIMWYIVCHVGGVILCDMWCVVPIVFLYL